MAIERIARAKINLALHVTGQRDDGYHLLDSLVSFAQIGDLLSFQPGHSISLMETGPFSEQLAGGGNLVLHASETLSGHMEQQGHPAPNAAITLEKNLPVASGIGGGSADAAAALLGLNAMAQRPASKEKLREIALSLGADVPMCLESLPARVTGIGEIIEPVSMPSLPMVLANPGAQIPTPTVFSALAEKQNAPLGELPTGVDAEEWIAWLSGQRNDLQAVAQEIAPCISDCLSALKDSGSPLVRMSGSGATCFAIYPSQGEADAAAATLASNHHDWWVVSTQTVRQTGESHGHR